VRREELLEAAARVLGRLRGTLARGRAREAALPLERAWQAWAAAVARVDEAVRHHPAIGAETLHAEAYRFLAGQVALASLKNVGYGDPDQPVLFRSQGIGYKWGFSNPDTLYISAVVADDREYRLSGTLGTCNQTIIGTYTGGTSDARVGERIGGHELQLGPDGSFELFIGRSPRRSHAIRPVDGAQTLAIYQVFADWERERKGELHLECLSPRAQPALTRAEIGRRLTRASQELESYVADWIGIGLKLDLIPANTATPPREIQLAHKDTFFTTGRWKLRPGEGLLVEVARPEPCRYWGWCLYSPWSETLDYEGRQTSLNHAQAAADGDGVIRVVISESDPGVPGWLDCAGHPEGTFAWRATTPTAPQTPRARVVSLAELQRHLPAGSRTVSPDERAEALRVRRRHLAHRMSP